MVWPCTCAWQGHARARGNATRMRVATNRAGILLAIMRPGQLKTHSVHKRNHLLHLSVVEGVEGELVLICVDEGQAHLVAVSQDHLQASR